MNRWTIVDYSDEEEENENEIDDQQNTNSNSNINTDNIGEMQKNNKTMQEKMIELKKYFDVVLFNIDDNAYRESHDEFIQLQKIYKQPPVFVKKDQVPHFFIYKLFEINQKLNEISSPNNEVRKFQKDIKRFSKLFKKELNMCKKNPEFFQNEISFDIDDCNDLNQEKISLSNNINYNDWFISSSDDDNSDNNKKFHDHYLKPKSNNMKEKILDSKNQSKNSNYFLNDDMAKKELDKYKESRYKGKNIGNIYRLFDLIKTVSNEKLVHEFQLEICFTFENEITKHGFSFDKFALILGILPNLMNDTIILFHFLERVEIAFLEYSIQSCNYSIKNLTLFTEIIPKYVNIMEEFKQKAQIDKKYELFTRIEIIILENIYYNKYIDIIPRVLNMHEMLDKKLFNESITENYKIQIALFNAFNLAIRKRPLDAADILDNIKVNTSFFQNANNQILFNRTIAQISISAFDEGHYKISYNFSKKLIEVENLDKKLGLKSLLYAQLQSIDEDKIISIYLFSIIFLQLPNMIVGINDQFNTFDKYKINQFIDHNKSIQLKKTNGKTKFGDKYKIIDYMIKYAKSCDWENAISFSLNEIGNVVSNHEIFCNNIKKVFLCCFLITNKSTSLKISLLIKMFYLQKETVATVINDMIKGIGPIERIQITFKGELIDEDKIILINNQSTIGTYMEYTSLMKNKIQLLQKGIDTLNSLKQ